MSSTILVTLAVVLAAGLTGCSHSAPTAPSPSTTSTSTPAAPVAVMATTVDAHGSTVALSSVSNVAFDLSASTGSRLTYTIAFGDGMSTSGGPVFQHQYGFTGSFAVVGTVTDALGRTATVSQTLAVASLPKFGNEWTATTFNQAINQNESRFLVFQSQSGDAVRGTYQSSSGDYAVRSMVGTLGSDGSVNLALTDGTISMNGFVALHAAAPSLTCGNCLSGTMVVTVQGGSADGKTLEFTPH
jgi:hypothetical protein